MRVYVLFFDTDANNASIESSHSRTPTLAHTAHMPTARTEKAYNYLLQPKK